MSSSAHEPLPDFESPPLDEMVLSIQFADLPLKNFHSGLLWLKLRNEYPNVEEQAPLLPTFETFGALRPAPAQEIKFLPPDAMIRYWFVTQDGTQLLQFQGNRLIHNWRRRVPEDIYPRYEPLRSRFESEILLTQEFLREYDLGDIRCNQCEVTYINSIGPNAESEDPVRDLAKLFTIWCERYNDGALKHIERGRFGATYLMLSDGGGDPVGRLYLEANPGIRTRDSAPTMQLKITARGRPGDETIGAALEWLDKGRVSVVRSFAAVTTETMHKIWGRKDNK